MSPVMPHDRDDLSRLVDAHVSCMAALSMIVVKDSKTRREWRARDVGRYPWHRTVRVHRFYGAGRIV